MGSLPDEVAQPKAEVANTKISMPTLMEECCTRINSSDEVATETLATNCDSITCDYVNRPIGVNGAILQAITNCSAIEESVLTACAQFVVGFDDARADFGCHLCVLLFGVGAEGRRIYRIEEAHL